MKRNRDGTIQKGTVLNPQGRPKGSLNKVSADVKELIREYVESELKNAGSLIEKLNPKDRLDILCKLLPYVMTKKKAEEEIPKNRIVTISFADPKPKPKQIS